MTSPNVVKEEAFDKTISCRICWTQSFDMSNIFNSTNETITSNIEFCTGIVLKQDDYLPTRICKNCLNCLSEAYNFKTMCLLSEQKCQRLLDEITDEASENIKYEHQINSNSVSDDVHEDVSEKNYDNEFDHVNDNVFDSDGDIENYASTVKKEFKDEFSFEITVERLTSDLSTDSEFKSKSQNSPQKRKTDQILNHCIEEDNIKNTTIIVTKESIPCKKKGPRLKKFKFMRLGCEPCGLKFKTREESSQHKKDVHSKDPYVCEVCGKTFLRRTSHYSHWKSHQAKSLACDSCDYRTANKYDLQRHMRIHLGIKKYECKICSASYRTSSNLRDHERRLHQNLRRFQCHICKKHFYDRTKLNRHIDSHMNIKRFQCDLCHTAFTRRCYWRKHLEKQHNIVVPNIRPGKRKNNLQLSTSTNDYAIQ